jgi:hypothetical protein
MNSENSLFTAIGTFEQMAKNLKGNPNYLLAAGLAQLAEGLHATLRKMDSRLTAIEDVLRSQSSS